MRSVTVASLLTFTFAPPAVQAQPGPCFWVGQLFTCTPSSQGDADVFVAQGVTGPASAFTADFSSKAIKDYSSGVHDAMVNKTGNTFSPMLSLFRPRS
jgi:hypothetical protein